MKHKYGPKKDKQIRETQTKDRYSGEASPHWDFTRQQQKENDGQMLEHVLANADSLSEESSLYHRPLTEVGELQSEAIRQTWGKLSARQRQVLELYGSGGMTLERTAIHLGISRLAVRTQLKRAQEAIQRCYLRLKLLQK